MAQESLGFRCQRFSLRFARTHSGILTSQRSTTRFHGGFTADGNAPLPLIHKYEDQASAGRLIPTILGANTLGWRAITHSFKEWLLLSQPPSCHGTFTSFAILSGHFGDLAVLLGSVPRAVGP